VLVPRSHVIGLEHAPEVLDQARAIAVERGLKNIKFEDGDVHALEYPDNTFDIVHAHQVLQHISDPIQALREMRRVIKPGGIVAVRDAGFLGMTWYPDVSGMNAWRDM
jgi:ubiquinone/menaquinone biosynthesis C-methylase UbiE